MTLGRIILRIEDQGEQINKKRFIIGANYKKCWY